MSDKKIVNVVELNIRDYIVKKPVYTRLELLDVLKRMTVDSERIRKSIV